MFGKTTAEHLSASTFCVVVGASECDATELCPLPAAATEGERLAQVLRATDGLAIPPDNIRCLVGQQATTQAVQAALNWVRSAATTDSTVLFYFAGHGIALGNGTFALCLADTVSTSDPATLLTSSWLEVVFRRCPSRGVLFILDCCGGAGMAERAPAMFSAVRQSEFRILLSASRESQSSWETDEGSFFTTFLLRVLSGQVALGEERGSIFFNDLYTYLHDSVLEYREINHPRLPLQEPVFAGSYLRDPLLFVHGKLSRARLVVRTRRYSKDYLRRVLLRSAGAVAAIGALAVGSYWTYLDQHEFARLTDTGLEVWHGHPTLQGFGLPRLVWTYDVGREEVSADSPLTSGAALVAAPGDRVVDLLPSQLDEPGLARWMWLTGDREASLILLRRITETLKDLPSPERVRAILMLASFGEKQDADLLLKAMPIVPADYHREVARGIVRLAQAAGFARLLNGDAGDVGQRLTPQAITELRESCTSSLQADFERFGRVYASRNDVPAMFYVATATGCKIPVSVLTAAQPAHMDVVAAHLETAYPGRRQDLIESLTRTLEATAVGRRDQSTVLAQLRLLALSPGGRCPALPHLRWLDRRWGLELHVAEILVRNCKDWRTDVAVTAPGHYQMRLLAPTDDEPRLVVTVSSRSRIGVSLVDLLELFERTTIPGDTEVLLDILRHSEEEIHCRIAAKVLLARGLRPPPEIQKFFDTTYTPLMTVATVYWATHHREAVIKMIEARLPDPAADFVPGVLAHLSLSNEERRALLQAASSERVSTERRAAVFAFFGEPHDVIDGLCSPDPAVRRATLRNVGFRSDLEELRQIPTPVQCRTTDVARSLTTLSDSRGAVVRFLAAGPIAGRDLRASIALFYYPTDNEGIRTWLRQQCLSCV
jgi:hypothetical protein